MEKNYFQLFIIFLILSISSVSLAAELRWSAVQDTQTCIIAGYKVHYGTNSEQLDNIITVPNLPDGTHVTSYDLDSITLLAATTYYFAVSAYSTDNLEGPASSPIPYMDSPNVVGIPSVNYTDNTIDVTFNESNMVNADIKASYSFSPTVTFDPDRSILRINKTYRLYLSYIPAHTIFTLTMNGITDNKGHALLSNSFTLNDDDNDSLADDWESDYGITSPSADSDSDGLLNSQEYAAGTNPNSADTDGDGMDDDWEIQHSLNPLTDDSLADNDNDGISNIDEYNGITTPPNSGPDTPVLSLPANASVNIQLIAQLTTQAYDDNENNAHAKTQWQISTEQTFADSQDFVFELETYDSLTQLTVPEFVLDPDQTYYWRVRFFDALGAGSSWSAPFSFTTVADSTPPQMVQNGTIDLNDDGVLDYASDTYKMVHYETKSLSLEASNNISAIDCLKAVDPDEITDTFGKPANLPLGLIQFRISVVNPGDTAELKIYFSEAVGTQWYKYDLANGWTEYSNDYPANVQFSADRKSVILRLVDGGAGDSDGVANGVIVDPSGPGAFVSGLSSAAGSVSGDSGGGGCFIATAAFGSYMEKHVKILRDFRDFYLLKTHLGTRFVHTYYKYSPPIADFIAEHAVLRGLVRVGLTPLIIFGYAVVHMSAFEQMILLLLTVGLTFATFKLAGHYIRRRRAQALPA
ncbi:MAG: hypothetical protein KKE62_10575 [Proteobacteria bacterium]|nr:hypothetical protein [Pseudomonadota bacterium]MBU1386660.1 hypothetical protein [Pseudomonadota bacterium]MBU1543271.1 hypothetical protein [Pseudomonadota bacterium]MBU2429570.1 hypothetical protein [Pseudomonadota bacterium]MBU2483102.1 hypothetical protein [Pseudomonadota bacterium]